MSLDFTMLVDTSAELKWKNVLQCGIVTHISNRIFDDSVYFITLDAHLFYMKI
jgi:hypothetical protein